MPVDAEAPAFRVWLDGGIVGVGGFGISRMPTTPNSNITTMAAISAHGRCPAPKWVGW